MIELKRTDISHLKRCDVIFNILIFDILINHLTHTISALTLAIYIYIYRQNKICDFLYVKHSSGFAINIH